jgi:hypothetical protein
MLGIIFLTIDINVVILGVVMLNVIILNVIMLSVFAVICKRGYSKSYSMS